MLPICLTAEHPCTGSCYLGTIALSASEARAALFLPGLLQGRALQKPSNGHRFQQKWTRGSEDKAGKGRTTVTGTRLRSCVLISGPEVLGDLLLNDFLKAEQVRDIRTLCAIGGKVKWCSGSENSMTFLKKM